MLAPFLLLKRGIKNKWRNILVSEMPTIGEMFILWLILFIVFFIVALINDHFSDNDKKWRR